MVTEQRMAGTADAPRTRRRRTLPVSFLIAGVAIVAAIVYLVLANTKTTAAYYMTVKEVQACTSCADRTVRVAGIVAPDSVVKQDGAQQMRFVIADGAQSLPVEYGGIVPDAFKTGTQVVVEGKLSGGVFHANTLLAKCPSKFQSATPGAQSASQ